MKRRKTDYIVVHCSATPPTLDIGATEIRKWHTDPPQWVVRNGKKINVGGQGWSDIGYARVIRLDGTIEAGRGIDEVGAHVAGYNNISVGICLVGGISAKTGRSENTFTPAQKTSLIFLLKDLKRLYPRAKILGHRDLSPDLDGDGKITSSEWIKECPSFDVRAWLAQIAFAS